MDVWHNCFQVGLDRSLRVIELAQRADNPRAEVGARYSAAMASMMVGDMSGIRRLAEAILAPAERLRDRYWLATAILMAGVVPQSEGDWDALRRLTDRGLQSMPMDPRLLGQRALIEFELGDQIEGGEIPEADAGICPNLPYRLFGSEYDGRPYPTNRCQHYRLNRRH